MLKKSFRDILIVKNRALGDSVFGLSVFSYLKTIYPEAQLTYALPAWITKLYQKVETDVDSFLPFDLSGVGGQFKFLNEIRKGKFDAIIELHDNPRSHRILEVARFLFRIPLFHHNHHLSHQVMTGIYDQGIRKAITQRDLDGVYSFTRFFNPVLKPPHFLNFLPKIKADSKKMKNQIVLGIVATRKEKLWPIKHFAKLVELFLEKDDYEFLVPISNSDNDKLMAQELIELTKSKVTIVQEALSDLPLAMAQASLYIGNDTGLKHICAALGLNTLTIFGPEEPLEWHPYDKNHHPYFWIYDCDVRSKMVDVCLLRQFDQERSIEMIDPQEVFGVTMHLMNKSE